MEELVESIQVVFNNEVQLWQHIFSRLIQTIHNVMFMYTVSSVNNNALGRISPRVMTSLIT